MWLCAACSRLFFFFFFFLLFAALVPRPAFYQLPVEGPDHHARPALDFRWRMMPVATDMFRSYVAAAKNPSIPKNYTARRSSISKFQPKIVNIFSRLNIEFLTFFIFLRKIFSSNFAFFLRIFDEILSTLLRTGLRVRPSKNRAT